MHEQFDDPELGLLRFDLESKEWRFELLLSDGRRAPGRITPEDNRLPLQAQGLDEIRRRVCWVRDNEASVRSLIAERMFLHWRENWFDEEIDTVQTPEEFRDAITLEAISILEDRNCDLIYDDGGLYGNHAIVLTLGDEGHVIYEPQIWG